MMDSEMNDFKFGMTLLHLSGIKPWNTTIWWKKYLSYFYMLHIRLGFIFLTIINATLFIRSSGDPKKMLDFMWRASGVFTLFAQNSLISMHGDKLVFLFTLPRGVQRSYRSIDHASLRKKYNFKLNCYVIGIVTFMIAYLIRKHIINDSVFDSANGEVEIFIPNMISNKVLAKVIHIHTSTLILQNFVILFGHDFLFIYSVAIAQAFLEYLKEVIGHLDLQECEIYTTRRLLRESRYTIKYCVNIHKHIIE